MLHLALLLCVPSQIVEANDFPEATQRAVLAATVRIVASDKERREGTGVVIREKGAFRYILTAAHVLEKAEQYEVHYFTAKSYPDPAECTRKVEVLATLPEQDLAVLRVPVDKLLVTPLVLAPREAAPKEARFAVLTTGCDKGAAPTCQTDEVRGKKLLRLGKDKASFYWESSKAPVGGRSGGPLVDLKGRVLGICSGNQEGHGYFTHLDEIHASLKREGLTWVLEGKDKD